MNVSPSDDLSSLLPPSQLGRDWLGDALADTRRETVNVVRLDDVLEAHDPQNRSRVFVKVDTQGYEAQVLAGLGERANRVAALQFEVPAIRLYEGMTDYAELLTITRDMGFVISGIFPVTLATSFASVDLDCVTVRRDLVEGHLRSRG